MVHALAALVLAAVLAVAPAIAAACAGPDEVPSIDLAEPALLSGPLHTVRPCARIEGHMARFEIDTRFGPLVADSLALLRIRVAELPAVEELERASHVGLAGRAAEDSVRRIGSTVESVATRPVETIAALPAGALRFFQHKLDDLAEAMQESGDRAGEHLAGAGEAYDRVSTRPGVVLHEPPADPWWERGGSRLWRLGKDWIGYGDTRRTWAQRLGVDPYSSNPMLNARMDSLAWAALAGDKAVGLATGQLDSASQAIGAARRINRMVWELPPAEVRRRNDQRLAALGCGEAERRRFLRNGRFTPTQQTALVDALVELQPASGCIDVVELAAALDVELEVRYLVDALAMLADLGITDAELRLVGSAPVLVHALPAPDGAETPEPDAPPATLPRREPGALEALAAAAAQAPRKRLVLPLPVDRLEWSEPTAAFFDVAAFRVVDKQVLIAGGATQNAIQGLTRRGWEIAEGIPTD